MLASALSEYIKRFAVLPGRNIAIFTNNDSAYPTAIDLNKVGVDSIIIIDSRPEMSSAATIKASELNIEVKFCSVVTNVQGSNKVKGIEIAKLNSETGLHDNELIYRDCDLLAISGGWSPRFTYIRNLEVGMHGVKSSIVLFQKTQTKKIPRLALPMDFGA